MLLKKNGNSKISSGKSKIVSSKKNVPVSIYVTRFMDVIKPKKAYDVLCKFVASPDSFSDIEIATEISSLLTNSLIEVGKDDKNFEALDIAGQIGLLEKYVSGRMTKIQVRNFYCKLFDLR